MEESSEIQQSDYASEPKLRDLRITFFTIPRWILLGLIRLYQKTVSQGLPANTCRFYPSCSHYGYQAIYKHGAIRGTYLAVRRVLRCNPFNPGGYDPIP
jgi:putative membrane protein insertion efficiency factor